MSIASGQVIGNYRVLQQIGTGGMGAVYLAEHPLIGKKVALKVIHKELAHNREVVGRFFNEARSVNRIGNEHIVEVHDFGQSPDGYNFFIMEYLEGRTLAQVLSAERYVSVQRGLHICAQIADALGAAHTAGIIHRDLKPDNIMLVMRLGDPDFVKILDFGLAKMFADGMMSNLTAAGVVLGTPQYMSPEACESKRDIDHRTDIYAVGILLFQMLCGQLPFDGESMGEVLIKQVMHAPPAPRGINQHIPPSVEQIILRCLAKSPDARFPTMMALRDALLDPDRYLMSSPPVVPAALAAAAPGARTIFDAGPSPSMSQPAVAAPLGYAPTAAVPALGGPQAGAGRSTGPQMALRAPPPSMVSDARTMFDPNMSAPSAPMPRGPSGPVGAQGNQATAIMEGGGFDHAAVAAMRRSTAMPGMQQPIVAENRTMVIGTPAGYKDRPPRRTWPIVLVLFLLAGAVGGGIAIAMMMNKKKSDAPKQGSASASAKVAPDDEPSGSGSGTASGSVAAVTPPDAAPAKAVVVDATPVAPPPVAPDAGPAVVEAILVKVRIVSDPSEAEVWIDGKQLGKTPTDVELAPDGADHELILRHPTRKEKKKTINITAATTIRLELEKGHTSSGTGSGTHHGSSKGSGKGTGKASGSGGDTEDDTMKPPWMK